MNNFCDSKLKVRALVKHRSFSALFLLYIQWRLLKGKRLESPFKYQENTENCILPLLQGRDGIRHKIEQAILNIIKIYYYSQEC